MTVGTLWRGQDEIRQELAERRPEKGGQLKLGMIICWLYPSLS